MNVKMMCVTVALAVSSGLSAVAAGADVTVENASFRLVLAGDGYAKSLVDKASGEECLAPGTRVPFARLRQDRPYDNELHLIHPAKPMWFPSDSIERKGDILKIGFADEYHVMKVKLSVTDDYVLFVPEGTDYVVTDDFGVKRRTELDGVEFLRLPVRDRARFGACANAVWDDSTAVSVMGLSPEVRICGDVPETAGGWRLMSAGTEGNIGLFGYGAALIAGKSSAFLDHVDALERDCGLPRGVRNRRDPIMKASYYFAVGRSGLCPATVDEHLELIRKGGFRLCVISYTAFSKTCGHFLWKDSYPNGLADLKMIADRLRAAGVVPGLHLHYNKVTVDDPYVTAGLDGRIACAKEVCLASDAGPDDDVFYLQSRPVGLRDDPGRRLVRFGKELVSFESVSTGRPWALLGVKRGLGNTPRQTHRRGEYGRHLDVDDCLSYYRVDQNTAIQDEIAGRLAEIIDTCGFRILYFDGGEDVPAPYWYNVPRAQKRVWDRLKTKPRGAESALKSHFGWHMLSRGNAFDTFYPERTRQSLDKYILPAARLAADDFSTVDFGWLGFYLPGEKTRRHRGFIDNNFADVTCGTSPEQIEMIARAAYENGAPLSIQLSPDRLKQHPQADAIMAVFKKYEDLKFAGIDLTKEPAE